MKKIIIPIFLLFSYLLVQAQTKEETLLYLNRFYQSIPQAGDDDIFTDCNFSEELLSIKPCVANNADGCTRREELLVPWKAIKFITLTHYDYKKLTAAVQYEQWGLEIDYLKAGEREQVYIQVNAGKEKIYCDRLVKAMLHMADLQGAKLENVSENLFDN